MINIDMMIVIHKICHDEKGARCQSAIYEQQCLRSHIIQYNVGYLCQSGALYGCEKKKIPMGSLFIEIFVYGHI